MQSDAILLSPEMTLGDAQDRLNEIQQGSWPAADGRRLLGLLTAKHLGAVLDTDLPVSSVMTEQSELFVYADQSLSYALARMGSAQVDALPVVSRANRSELIGILRRSDVLTAFGVGK